ncbi:hypothetical protein PYCCODRAFT_1393200 [Trametes coccinea BRFM310]|uniref:Protein kinase domain-containing protein n=1 Tax=Trametes coccinea (strain BRFM310) TaxID=1353009 RepID=A0A1Y2IHM7_TRAC3|nr:hypothetical protein PYCCODRAFT_1393200 [Trametes coccinea BRFM310]
MPSRAVETSSGNPPWYVMDENGQIMPLEVPTRLKEHPELVRRGLEPVDPSKIGVVYRTFVLKKPLYYIKIVDTSTEEAAVYQRLRLQCMASPNHTIPGEITPPEAGHPLLITPELGDFGLSIMRASSLYDSLARFLQLIEGLEYMHNQHIAHMDICLDNVVAAPLWKDPPYPDVEPGKMYYIDFGSSLQLPFGPGVQRAISLGPSQYALQYDIHNFDPYSWDVYCAALTLRATLDAYRRDHWCFITRLYLGWLEGNERGCAGVCRCRPTARRARQLLAGILWCVGIWEGTKNVLRRAMDGIWSPFS